MEELRFSEYCANCRKSLAALEKILFVEKELGRCFCCEECIRDYFQPHVDFMDEEYRRLRTDSDLSESDCLRFSHYRSLALEDPDEVWLDLSETGERHFTFISHFRPGNGDERVSYVVVCLAIDGVPSFVFLGFASRDEDLVDEYRRGTDMRVRSGPGFDDEESVEQLAAEVAALPEVHLQAVADAVGGEQAPSEATDDLSTFERLYAELRQAGDIPRELFERFESYVEPTLDDPDEIWRFVDDEGNEWCTFIASHSVLDNNEEIDEFTMIAVCEPARLEGGGPKSLEVIFTFPTIDPGLVQHFRKGINSLNKAFGVGWTRGRVA